MATSFEQCIIDGLAEKGIGKKKQRDVLEAFNYSRNSYEAAGVPKGEAELRAMTDAFIAVDRKTRDASIAHMKAVTVQLDTIDRVRQGYNVKLGGLLTPLTLLDPNKSLGTRGIGYGLARAAISMLSSHSQFKGVNFEQVYRSYRNKYFGLMTDVLDNFGKGAFGRQIGKAHEMNVVRELFGEQAGDQAAKEISIAFKKVTDLIPDDMVQAGGAMNKLADFNLPQRDNAAKVLKSQEVWIEKQQQRLAWDKMRMPDGMAIKEEDKVPLLQAIWGTKASDGKNKIRPDSFRGLGHSIGNMLDQHRFLVYKDADAWMANHKDFGDGSVFDVMSSYVDSMSHKLALVQMFGRNPEMWAKNVKAIVASEAANAALTASVTKGARKNIKAVADANSVMGDRKLFDNMFDTITHKNHMDPNNPWATGVISAANLMMSAHGGSILFAAMPGDFSTTLATRFINHMPLRSGIDTYLQAFTLPGGHGDFQRQMNRLGYIADEATNGTYATERFSGIGTYGPAWTRRLSDATMRASLLTRHTNDARGVAAKSIMGMLDDYRDDAFADLPFRHVMERYGITERDWNVVRKLPPYSPNGSAMFVRPLDILDTNLIDKSQLYQKFFSLVDAEAHYMVPASTIEASATMKVGTRPDTIGGAALYSMGMFKNFAFTFLQQYGRLALSSESYGRRLSFIAGLGLSTVAVGALAVQLRQLATGKTPLSMDKATFWGSAIMAGGGLGIWGDFLFGGVNAYSQSPAEVMGGPLAALTADTANLALGDAFKWAALGGDTSAWQPQAGSRAVTWLKRNTPGTSIWWSKLVLEREIWDRLDKWIDPRAQQKFRAKARRQQKQYGNTYYSKPGESLIGQ